MSSQSKFIVDFQISKWIPCRGGQYIYRERQGRRAESLEKAEEYTETSFELGGQPLDGLQPNSEVVSARKHVFQKEWSAHGE